MELTDNDRQRIEQEAKDYANSIGSNDGHPRFDYIKGAEYATIFERQQQEPLAQSHTHLYNENKRLEAERTDLLAKVSEQSQRIQELEPIVKAYWNRLKILEMHSDNDWDAEAYRVEAKKIEALLTPKP